MAGFVSGCIILKGTQPCPLLSSNNSSLRGGTTTPTHLHPRHLRGNNTRRVVLGQAEERPSGGSPKEKRSRQGSRGSRRSGGDVRGRGGGNGEGRRGGKSMGTRASSRSTQRAKASEKPRNREGTRKGVGGDRRPRERRRNDEDEDGEVDMSGFGTLPDPFASGNTAGSKYMDRKEEHVTIVEPVGGRHMECGIEASVTWKGARYMACYPCGHAVIVGKKDVRGNLDPVDHDRMKDDFFEAARKAVLKVGWTLVRSGFLWTMDQAVESERVDSYKFMDEQGVFADTLDDEDFPQGGSEDYLQRELEKMAGDDYESGGEGGEEDVEEICDFQHKGKDYAVVHPFEPILLLAKQKHDTVSVPTEAEIRAVTPLLEKEIQNPSRRRDAVKDLII